MIARLAPPPLAAALLALSLCQPALAARPEAAAPAKAAQDLDGTQVALAQVSQPLLEAEAVQHAPRREAAAADEPALTEPGALGVAGAGLVVLLLAGRRRAGTEAFADKR